ncbi:hypothetical protein B0T22DRAFT_66347 [Podospora appendiculata]|uniref:Uncharacterized protein n=1 Tax=Podospora appendiculata TaxID=314037 RepID=A0AAE0XJW5_9PEZI|nr:hypothetical protein B0T22DRAFT_66347 [Podospora appendiculata]
MPNSSRLIPQSPASVMVMRDVTPSITTLSLPFKRFGIIPIGGRATLVKLTSGGLVVFSPVALTEEVRAKVLAMGNDVRYIIAPDIEHHIFISEWKSAYPAAQLIGPAGLPEKRAKLVGEDLKISNDRFDHVFTSQNKGTFAITPEFDADFAYEFVDAHPNKELVFFFRPDRVLIEADLMFNLPATEQYSRVPGEDGKPGWMGWIFTKLQSTAGDAKGQKQFLWHLASRGDRPAFNESVRRIAEWDFETVIPCHGDVIQRNGKQVFEKVFEWHLKKEGDL